MIADGYLVLESGEIFPGLWRGGEERAGEVVFNTGHSGYEEMATDPSYFRQILVMTAPMQGNYGASRTVWESSRIWIQGFICLELQASDREHNWQATLDRAGVGMLSAVDTRKLTVRLRSSGTPWGAIVHEPTKERALAKASGLIRAAKAGSSDWVYEVSRKSNEVRAGQSPGGPRVAVMDYGCKENTLRELVRRCREIKIFPSRATASEINEWRPDGILLSNGPGDPGQVEVAVQTVRDLIGTKFIFGICMGHQILSLALGAKTYKLKFGHRGSNHPIRDELLNQIYMTSQNHGYAVDHETLPSGVQVTHTNLNDGTVSGIYHPAKKCLGVQFHPESHPGPHESVGLFDFFVKQIS